MAHDSTTLRSLAPGDFRKRLDVEFDQFDTSSDGGVVILRAADRRLRLTEKMAECLRDDREPTQVTHQLHELFAQRVLGIACGYPDGNDSARLGNDPVHKIALGRHPREDAPLASQPTVSRFENSASRTQLFRMGESLAEVVIERHRKRLHGRARQITLDFDPTDDPTHGQQEFTAFNSYYKNWCYLPLLGFLTFDKEPDQYLFAALLRSGRAVAKHGLLGILKRVLPRLRQAFPKARFLVRLDGGFAAPEVFEFLEAQPKLKYVVGMAKNVVLERQAEKLMRKARRASKKSQKTEHLYGETSYAAKKWPHQRRVIIKAEVTRLTDREPKDNPRFVVTNLRQSPRYVYENVYCQRGEIENRIKELKDGLSIGRTSCTRFSANQLRVLMTAAAFVLMQELRLRAARTSCARAQVSTLRERLLKVAARVVISVRRFVLHLPANFPFLHAWRRIALSFGAASG